MRAELKPCPFCGGDASEANAVQDAKVHMQVFASAAGTAAWRVECRCGVTGRGFDGALGSEKATAFWNNRADNPLIFQAIQPPSKTGERR